jgi:superfamily II DNA helicase RecQ
MEVTVKQVMARYFGYSQFKPGQEELINKILASRDILGVMPPGAANRFVTSFLPLFCRE